MRSKVILSLTPDHNGKFATDENILVTFRKCGWQPIEVSVLENELLKKEKYKELSKNVTKFLPNLVAGRNQNVIFYGRSQDTEVMVTRPNDGEIIVRLWNEDPRQLFRSTENMMEKLGHYRINDKPLLVFHNHVWIYERGHDRLIAKGRVILNVFEELTRANTKDIVFSVFSLFFVILMFVGLHFTNPADRLLVGTMERASTALLTTSILSVVSIVQAYFTLRNKRIIDWKFTSGESEEREES